MAESALLVGAVICTTPFLALLIAPATCRRIMVLAWRDEWQKPWTDYVCRGLTLLALLMAFGLGGFVLLATLHGFGIHGETIESIAACIGGIGGAALLIRLARAAGIR